MDKHSNKVTFCKLSRFFRILFIDFSGLYSSKFPLEKKCKGSTNHANNTILPV